MIPQSTSNALIEEMIGIDLKELGKLNAQNSARKRYVRSCRMVPKLLKQTKPIDYLKGVPKEWCLILKQQCSHCPLCKNSNRSEEHMRSQHGVEIIP